MNDQELWENVASAVIHYVKQQTGSIPENMNRWEIQVGPRPERPNETFKMKIKWKHSEPKPSYSTLKSYTVADVTASYKEYVSQFNIDRIPNMNTEMRWMLSIIKAVSVQKLPLSAKEFMEIMTDAWEMEMARELDKNINTTVYEEEPDTDRLSDLLANLRKKG